MATYTFSRFAYFDTNIISTIAKDRSMWPELFSFLKERDLTMALSSAQVAELADAPRLHEALVALFVSVPCGVLKTWDMIIAEEVSSHPGPRSETLLMYPLNAILLEENGLNRLRKFLSSKELRKARQEQKAHAKLMGARHSSLEANFPPTGSGRYDRGQADQFAEFMVMQWLAEDHRPFLERMQGDISAFHPEAFLSIRTYAYVIFYKYYLGQRGPTEESDFADLSHLFYLPYCELVVTERDVCNVLNQIKGNHDVLAGAVVRNIDFLSDWQM